MEETLISLRVVVSGGGSGPAGAAGGLRPSLPASSPSPAPLTPNPATVCTNRRRSCCRPVTAVSASIVLPFQFLLQFPQEPPVGGLGDDLLGAALDHPGVAQTQRVEP